MRIYIAGPFSHTEERESLEHMIDLIKKKYPEANLYIPMEFKVEEDYQKEDGTWNLPNYEWAKRVYESDIKHLDTANMVIALYVGHYCSSGTIWEMGYAKGKGIPVVVYIPECVNGDMSLMVMNGFDSYFGEDSNFHPITEDFLSKFNQK